MDRQLVQLEDKGSLRKDDPSALEKGGRWAILLGSELPTNERYAREKQVDSFSLPLPVWCQFAGAGQSLLHARERYGILSVVCTASRLLCVPGSEAVLQVVWGLFPLPLPTYAVWG